MTLVIDLVKTVPSSDPPPIPENYIHFHEHISHRKCSIVSDPLVLCATKSGVLHPIGHHAVALHVLLCKDPHPVVCQIIIGGDEVNFNQVYLWPFKL